MKRIKSLSIILLLMIAFSTSTFAQHEEITGLWKTIDDETGDVKSIVNIYLQDGKLFGDIKKIFPKEGTDQNPTCTKCDDDDPRKDKPIIGMTIITDMELDEDDNEWEDGEILDPKKGKTYDCKLWVEDGKLQVRGYVLFFHRTQEWIRFEGEI
ncbi:MAG: DUF2147 domain-containing protein [Melioribacteraceae bacterium]